VGHSRPPLIQVEGNNVNSDFWLLERHARVAVRQPSGDAVRPVSSVRTTTSRMLARLGFNCLSLLDRMGAAVEPRRGEVLAALCARTNYSAAVLRMLPRAQDKTRS